MSDIEQKATAIVQACCYNGVEFRYDRDALIPIAALCFSIEQHEAAKQELKDLQQKVSDSVKVITSTTVDDGVWRTWVSDVLSEFIIPASKPDPLAELFLESFAGSNIGKNGGYWNIERKFRAGMEARGLQIVEVKNDE